MQSDILIKTALVPCIVIFGPVESFFIYSVKICPRVVLFRNVVVSIMLCLIKESLSDYGFNHQ